MAVHAAIMIAIACVVSRIGAEQETRAGLEDLLQSAVAGGELKRGTDIAALARTVEAMVNGSMMTWAFYAEGPAERWIRHDVDAVLAPYLPGARQR